MSLRRTSLAALGLALALSLSHLANAAPPVDPKPMAKPAASPKEAIKDAYARQDKSLDAKSFQGFLDVHTKDYSILDPKGNKIELKQFQQQMGPMIVFAKTVESKTIVQKLVADSKKGDAKVKQHLNVFVADPRGQNGQTYHIVVDAVSDDVWINSPKGWKMKRSKYLKYDGTANGKPLAEALKSARKSMGGGKMGGGKL